MKLRLVVEHDPETKRWAAFFPELPGCAGDGPTKAKALAAADRVAKEWIDTARSLGRPIPTPRGRLVFA